jgi:hypothetical protein
MPGKKPGIFFPDLASRQPVNTHEFCAGPWPPVQDLDCSDPANARVWTKRSKQHHNRIRALYRVVALSHQRKFGQYGAKVASANSRVLGRPMAAAIRPTGSLTAVNRHHGYENALLTASGQQLDVTAKEHAAVLCRFTCRVSQSRAGAMPRAANIRRYIRRPMHALGLLHVNPFETTLADWSHVAAGQSIPDFRRHLP